MQSKDDMAVSLMSMTPEAEELLLDRIEAEVQREQAARDQLSLKKDQRSKQRQEIQAERVKVKVLKCNGPDDLSRNCIGQLRG